MRLSLISKWTTVKEVPASPGSEGEVYLLPQKLLRNHGLSPYSLGWFPGQDPYLHQGR